MCLASGSACQWRVDPRVTHGRGWHLQAQVHPPAGAVRSRCGFDGPLRLGSFASHPGLNPRRRTIHVGYM